MTDLPFIEPEHDFHMPAKHKRKVTINWNKAIVIAMFMNIGIFLLIGSLFSNIKDPFIGAVLGFIIAIVIMMELFAAYNIWGGKDER